MSKFIEVTDVTTGSEYLININNISWISGTTLCLNGVHGEGNGLLQLDCDSYEKIIKEINKNGVKSIPDVIVSAKSHRAQKKHLNQVQKDFITKYYPEIKDDDMVELEEVSTLELRNTWEQGKNKNVNNEKFYFFSEPK